MQHRRAPERRVQPRRVDVQPVVVDGHAQRAKGGDPELDEGERAQRGGGWSRALATPPAWLPAPRPSMNAATMIAIE